MNIDPTKQVLPVYQLLCGVIRVASIFFVSFALTVIISELTQLVYRYGWSIRKIFSFFSNSFALSQIAGFLIVAAFLWFGNKRIARWCTPMINLKCCQVCGYDLRHGNTLRCPECGFTEPNKANQD
jgi:hypothetical protein